MPIIPFNHDSPIVAPNTFVAPDAWISGKVTLSENVSVFFGACIRGDLEKISVGEGSNIQELSVLHTSKGVCECIVGPRVTIGHRAILHSCHIEGHSIIGMGATVLDRAVIGKYCIIGANSLVPIGMVIPEGSLAYGAPAKVIRQLTETERAQIADTASRYIVVGQTYGRYFDNSSSSSAQD